MIFKREYVRSKVKNTTIYWLEFLMNKASIPRLLNPSGAGIRNLFSGIIFGKSCKSKTENISNKSCTFFGYYTPPIYTIKLKY